MANGGSSQVIDALMVEDDEGDVVMTKEAFEYYKISNRLHVVSDGDQALAFLRRTGPYADAPRPGLILLDVNLPRRSGLEVLAELKQDPDLLLIPVVMLTTSRAEEDITAATRCTPTRSSASRSTSSTSSTRSGRSTISS